MQEAARGPPGRRAKAAGNSAAAGGSGVPRTGSRGLRQIEDTYRKYMHIKGVFLHVYISISTSDLE